MPFDKLRAQVHRTDGDGKSPSVGYRRAADRRSDERTRFSFAKSDDGSSSPAPMREETVQKSVRVVSAVELVKQTSQRDDAETETKEHKPPAVDRGQDD
jgi:hypothetical protein